MPIQQKITPHTTCVWLPYTGDRLQLRAEITQHLKLQLKDPQGELYFENGAPQWRVNATCWLSYAHTQGMAILVYSLQGPVGVDLELFDRVNELDYFAIAKRFFNKNEYAQLCKMPITEAALAFLNLWIKKEAYAKYTRKGLSRVLALELESKSIANTIAFTAIQNCPSEYLGVICVGA